MADKGYFTKIRKNYGMVMELNERYRKYFNLERDINKDLYESE